MPTGDFSALPERMQNRAVWVYYEMLIERRGSFLVKRLFDILLSALLLILLSPVFFVVAVSIKLDSKGTIFYRQVRVTKNLRTFRILKFRTMIADADKKGPLVTVGGDRRITRIGQKLRKSRLDELPQLINVLLGDMSFVGTRPEVLKYVDRYTDEMLATLLLPAGVTSMASIRFLDEESLLQGGADVDEIYIDEILPKKMLYNLEYLRDYKFFGDLRIMYETFFAVSKR